MIAPMIVATALSMLAIMDPKAIVSLPERSAPMPLAVESLQEGSAASYPLFATIVRYCFGRAEMTRWNMHSTLQHVIWEIRGQGLR